MATYQVEQISNGLIVTKDDKKTFYRCIDSMVDGLTKDMKERYREASHFEWDGNFSITIDADGLP